MLRYLIIVAKDQPGLCDYLKRSFAGDESVQVLVDRRQGERRQRVEPREPERRLGERRHRTDPDFPHRPVVIIGCD